MKLKDLLRPINWIQRIAIILCLIVIDRWLKAIEGGKYRNTAWTHLGGAIGDLEASFGWYYTLRYDWLDIVERYRRGEL